MESFSRRSLERNSSNRPIWKPALPDVAPFFRVPKRKCDRVKEVSISHFFQTTMADTHLGSGVRAASEKYHHTLTLFWMRLVAAALVETPEGCAFEEFLTAHAELCDKNLPSQYYSQDLLRTPAARDGWVEPDLRPLPHLRVYRCG